MDVKQIRDWYNAEPFEPFDILVTDGRQLAVHSREHIMASPGGREVLIIQPDSSFDAIPVEWITELTHRSTASSSQQ